MRRTRIVARQLQHSSFLIQNSSFLIHNSLFNTQFLVFTHTCRSHWLASPPECAPSPAAAARPSPGHPKTHHFSMEESSFSIVESLKNLHFVLKNLHFPFEKRTSTALSGLTTGRPKIVIFEGKNLHFVDWRIFIYALKNTHRRWIGHPTCQPLARQSGIASCRHKQSVRNHIVEGIRHAWCKIPRFWYTIPRF